MGPVRFNFSRYFFGHPSGPSLTKIRYHKIAEQFRDHSQLTSTSLWLTLTSSHLVKFCQLYMNPLPLVDINFSSAPSPHRPPSCMTLIVLKKIEPLHRLKVIGGTNLAEESRMK